MVVIPPILVASKVIIADLKALATYYCAALTLPYWGAVWLKLLSPQSKTRGMKVAKKKGSLMGRGYHVRGSWQPATCLSVVMQTSLSPVDHSDWNFQGRTGPTPWLISRISLVGQGTVQKRAGNLNLVFFYCKKAPVLAKMLSIFARCYPIWFGVARWSLGGARGPTVLLGFHCIRILKMWEKVIIPRHQKRRLIRAPPSIIEL